MPTYRITSPDGRTFRVSGPGSQDDALAHVQSQVQAEPGQAVRDLQTNVNVGKFDVNKRPLSMGEYAQDALDSTMTGLGQGLAALPGLPGTAQKVARDVVGPRVSQRTGIPLDRLGTMAKAAMAMINPLSAVANELPQLPDVNDTISMADKGLHAAGIKEGEGLDYQPKSQLGRDLQTGASFVPGMGGGGIVRNALVPGIAYQEIADRTDSKMLPLVAAMVAPSLLRGAGRTVTPFVADAERLGHAQALEREGIPLTAGQRTGNRLMRYAEDEVGGPTGQRFNERQAEAFTNAALQRAAPGTRARRATPEVMDQIHADIGDQFDQLGARNVVAPDHQFGRDLGDALREYNANTAASTRIPAVQNIIADLIQAAPGRGRFPASRYQSIRSKLEARAREARDPDLKRAYRSIRIAVDDVMERSIAATNHADVGLFRNARRRYRNYLVLEDAAGRLNENASLGFITPTALASATKVKHGVRNMVHGHGDFARLARAGSALLRPLPNSGTASRATVRALGAAAGFGSGEDYQSGIQNAVLGGFVTPAILARVLLSRPGRGYLGNQALAGFLRQPSLIGRIAGAVRHP